jgi:hypothetical protein
MKLIEIIEMLCLRGKGHPVTGGDGVLVVEVTNALSWDIRAVLHEVYSTRRSSVRWVNGTQQLDQEEALAFVLAHLRGYELLPDEARSIGNEARKAALLYKGRPPGVKGAKLKPSPTDQELKDAASTAKSKAKAAAAKDAALAPGLEQRLADIDAVLAADRGRLACVVVTLDWPARNSVVRDVPAAINPDSELTAAMQVHRCMGA